MYPSTLPTGTSMTITYDSTNSQTLTLTTHTNNLPSSTQLTTAQSTPNTVAPTLAPTNQTYPTTNITTPTYNLNATTTSSHLTESATRESRMCRWDPAANSCHATIRFCLQQSRWSECSKISTAFCLLDSDCAVFTPSSDGGFTYAQSCAPTETHVCEYVACTLEDVCTESKGSSECDEVSAQILKNAWETNDCATLTTTTTTSTTTTTTTLGSFVKGVKFSVTYDGTHWRKHNGKLTSDSISTIITHVNKWLIQNIDSRTLGDARNRNGAVVHNYRQPGSFLLYFPNLSKGVGNKVNDILRDDARNGRVIISRHAYFNVIGVLLPVILTTTTTTTKECLITDDCGVEVRFHGYDKTVGTGSERVATFERWDDSVFSGCTSAERDVFSTRLPILDISGGGRETCHKKGMLKNAAKILSDLLNSILEELGESASGNIEGAAITSFDESSGRITFVFPKVSRSLAENSLTDIKIETEEGVILTASKITFLGEAATIEPSGLLDQKLLGFFIALMLVVLLTMAAFFVGGAVGIGGYARVGSVSFMPF